ncbi:MAG: hypothetical protein QG616_385 [Pseudomonadota bacterium]|nr:hypothetical protein [Pseudomonadota bacterium]MDQ5880555.1 hypothetical protein [Pseudomonadota bacterium]MDQ5903440.1 hypothetical protein [Pseudomonadota bacterium]MDQ5907576.1 hypothetical protein [Pseudomonadota bacterium]MDQ5914871.1 hypothetical protein [Pseudomonadota bacterium]
MPSVAEWDLSVVRWACCQNDDPRELSFVDPLLRRRLSPLARGALHVANACAHDCPSASFVFSSRHGELQRTVDLLSNLAQSEEMSPTLFSLSVPNSAAGIFSIARGDHAPATAIAAGVESFGYGLLEAYLRTQQEPTRPIVYVYADAPAPHPLGQQPGDPEAVFAIGLLIDRAGPIRLRTRICPSDEPGTPMTLQANACRQALEKGVADWTDGHRHWNWTLQ